MKYNKLLISFILFFSFLNIYSSKTIEVTLSKCVDGDTARFILDEEEVRARFLAIDTPESVHPNINPEVYGKDASEYTCKLLTNATKIELEYDDNSDKQDKYNRELVWVFVDGELLQEKLISVGYAEVKYLYGDYKYTEQLNKVQEKAKEDKLGIWALEETDAETEDVKEETKKETNKDSKTEKKDNNIMVFDIGGLEIEISKDNTLGILLIVILSIVLLLSKSKIRVKRKK